jgi:hypothetical protein
MAVRDWRRLKLFVCVFLTTPTLTAQSPKVPVNQAETSKAWEALERKDYRGAIAHADLVIIEFEREANQKQTDLKKSIAPKPPVGEVTDETIKKAVFSNALLNDVATCLFIKGEALEKTGRPADAKRSYEAACKLTYARTWDPAGWFWDPSAKSCDRAVGIK